jgi:uroporphyrinogen-III synthase
MGMAKQSDPIKSATAGVPVLITRPDAEAQAFAIALRRRFGPRVAPLIAPLIAPRYLAPPVSGLDVEGLIFTSVHGVEGARLLGLSSTGPAYCVGRKTASAARAAGIEALSADGDADALYALILAKRPGGRLLHVRGEESRGDLDTRLTAAGIPTRSLVVYRQEPLPLSDEAACALRHEGKIVVTLFSPRSAALFVAALPDRTSASLHLAVMSPAVAAALTGLKVAALTVADRPDANGMLDAVATLLGAEPSA